MVKSLSSEQVSTNVSVAPRDTFLFLIYWHTAKNWKVEGSRHSKVWRSTYSA